MTRHIVAFVRRELFILGAHNDVHSAGVNPDNITTPGLYTAIPDSTGYGAILNVYRSFDGYLIQTKHYITAGFNRMAFRVGNTGTWKYYFGADSLSDLASQLGGVLGISSVINETFVIPSGQTKTLYVGMNSLLYFMFANLAFDSGLYAIEYNSFIAIKAFSNANVSMSMPQAGTVSFKNNAPQAIYLRYVLIKVQ